MLALVDDLGANGEHQLPITDLIGGTSIAVVDTTRFLTGNGTCSEGGVEVGEIGDRAGGAGDEENEEGDDGEGELDRREMHLAALSQQASQAKGKGRAQTRWVRVLDCDSRCVGIRCLQGKD